MGRIKQLWALLRGLLPAAKTGAAEAGAAAAPKGNSLLKTLFWWVGLPAMFEGHNQLNRYLDSRIVPGTPAYQAKMLEDANRRVLEQSATLQNRRSAADMMALSTARNDREQLLGQASEAGQMQAVNALLGPLLQQQMGQLGAGVPSGAEAAQQPQAVGPMPQDLDMALAHAPGGFLTNPLAVARQQGFLSPADQLGA